MGSELVAYLTGHKRCNFFFFAPVLFIALSRLLLLLPLLLSYAVQPHRSMRVTVVTRTLVHKINVAKDDS